MDLTARKLASELLRIKAVLLRPEEPFVWASGWHSPIYCDNRRILSDPSLRGMVAGALAEVALREWPEAGIVAGVATGAIAHGALAADRMGKPFVYVRPKPKDHGTGSQVEGVLPPGSKVVVIEDLISTGGSAVEVVEALREAGAEVLGIVSIFTYGMRRGLERLAAAGVVNHSLSNLDALVEVAASEGYIAPEWKERILRFRDNPSDTSWIK